MVSRVRKLPQDATSRDRSSNKKDELVELGLHLALRIATARRLRLPKVRLDMIDIELCERLLDIIRREVDVELHQ